jgi:hypothetical protein
MNTIRFAAAACSACITFAVLSAVLSLAEPNRSTVQAKRHDPSPAPAVQVEAAVAKASPQPADEASSLPTLPMLSDD